MTCLESLSKGVTGLEGRPPCSCQHLGSTLREKMGRAELQKRSWGDHRRAGARPCRTRTPCRNLLSRFVDFPLRKLRYSNRWREAAPGPDRRPGFWPSSAAKQLCDWVARVQDFPSPGLSFLLWPKEGGVRQDACSRPFSSQPVPGRAVALGCPVGSLPSRRPAHVHGRRLSPFASETSG